MPEYDYKALATNAKETEGTIEADSVEDAIHKLRQKKLFPLRVKIISGIEPPKTTSRKYLKYKPTTNPLLRLIYQIRRKRWQKRYKKDQERKRKKLLPRKEEIIANTLAILDGCLRRASIAQIGGFHPPEDPKVSWFGNVRLAQKVEG